ncbi:MAG: hypothetical protein IT197_10005 [Acidimicrobiia bacterium]|nr:hypothetical protein [Acidimicrobiia bacterium]
MRDLRCLGRPARLGWRKPRWRCRVPSCWSISNGSCSSR